MSHPYSALTPDVVLDACASIGLHPDGRLLAHRLEVGTASIDTAGLAGILVRTGKFRPDELEHSRIQPDAIVSSVAQLPDWLESNL